MPDQQYQAVDDIPALRDGVLNKIKDAATARFPLENERYRIELADVQYDGAKPFTLQQQKDAIVKGKSLTHRLYGTWRMYDKNTDKMVDERRDLIAHVPWLTQRGTFIRNGSEYTVANQSRLRAGAFARRKNNGELEAHFNVLEGGRPFRVVMDPSSMKLTMQVGGAKMNLAPVMRALGYTDDALRKEWGEKVLDHNNVYDDSDKRALQRLRSKRDPEDMKLAEIFARMRMDPMVTSKTLGAPLENVTPEAIMTATKRLLAISRGEAKEDDRDAVYFQHALWPDDLFAERLALDYGGELRRKVLWNSTHAGKLKVQPGQLDKHIGSVFIKSGLAMPLEEVNPMDMYDQRFRLLRTGEGGISETGIPLESRSVQPSHFGFIDGIRTPESGRVGVDSRLTISTYRGKDGQLYTKFTDKLGRPKYLSAEEASESVLAFPGELDRPGNQVRAMHGGELTYVDKKDVDYVLPHTSYMFSAGTNMVPMLASTGGSRVIMGGKMTNQALPLKEPEAPLVQTLTDEPDVSFEERYGFKVGGAIRADERGHVTKVTPNEIHVRTATGPKVYELYNDFPLNRKTRLHNTPAVRVGDQVKAGALLARSNVTDSKGALALGTNLRTAYIPWRGATYEDSIVISESAAKKLSSEHMYPIKVDVDEGTKRGRKEFVSMFPGRFDEKQLKSIDSDGVVKVGAVVREGDPLVLSVREKRQSDIHRGHKPGWTDVSEVWDHENEGVVTAVDKTEKGTRVFVKSFEPMRVADKLSGRLGDKGTISMVLPDDQMPTDSEGRPFEILLNPVSVVTRTNPSQIVEAVLGKIAEKRGEKYRVPAFMDGSYIQFAEDELKKHGMSDTETIKDPASNREYKDILTGNRFFMKLHHMAEHKVSARDVGGYSAEDQPSRGGEGSAKRVSTWDTNALLSHGAVNVLRDTKLVRGRKNSEFWKAFQMGQTPPSPDVPTIYRKFLASLIGSGINVSKRGGKLQLMAMTDKHVNELAHGEVTKAAGVDAATMKEIPGGLFDPTVTGGHDGQKWSFIRLREPMPNPVMEKPILRLLGITGTQMQKILSGDEKLHGKVGGHAIQEGLKRINLKKAKAKAVEDITSGVKTRRDKAVKLYKDLLMLEETGLKPAELVVTKVPVLPPKFRPIASTSSFIMKSDANSLYMDLMKANEAYKAVKDNLGEEFAGEERANLYKAFAAVGGLGDPVSPKLVNQGVRGLLKQVIGSRPKSGMFNRRVLGGAVDLSGRAVISVNPALNMDQVGLPKDMAWTLFRRFVMRDLVSNGMSAVDAVKAVKNKTGAAQDALMRQMAKRPVLINRAPTLHKYNIMAAYPVVVKGNAIHVSPVVTPPYGADFDGDAMQVHVPVSDEAVDDAREKMLPSKNLFSIADFDKPMYVPTQEYAYGLYLASKEGKKKKAPKVFATKTDALAAYKRGDLGLHDPVRILE